MDNLYNQFKNYAVSIPKLLLPKKGTDMKKWAVIACDQYTSETDYWKNVETFIGDSPSTIHMIFPECYLEEENPQARINTINKTMAEYISKGVMEESGPQFVLVKRTFKNSDTPRWGLMAALDLEHYDYSPNSKTLIRATEGTIIERIPPRKRIRENAPIELPHIMVLLDDRERMIIEPLAQKSESLTKLYEFDLMMESGHLAGYSVKEDVLIEGVLKGLKILADKKRFKNLFNTEDILLFAMGDGNHSLATAKSVWEDIKKNEKNPQNLELHPARYALVELVNLYDPGIEFEPIYRVLFSINREAFFAYLDKLGFFTLEKAESLESVLTRVEASTEGHTIGYVSENGYGVINCRNPEATMAVGTLQNVLDAYLKEHKETAIDYIHGIDVTDRLGKVAGNMGFFLPPINKGDFFKTILRDGALPRKTFSMGEASEKRFYLEARRIL